MDAGRGDDPQGTGVLEDFSSTPSPCTVLYIPSVYIPPVTARRSQPALQSQSGNSAPSLATGPPMAIRQLSHSAKPSIRPTSHHIPSYPDVMKAAGGRW
jgi:hypothetical protein